MGAKSCLAAALTAGADAGAGAEHKWAQPVTSVCADVPAGYRHWPHIMWERIDFDGTPRW